MLNAVGTSAIWWKFQSKMPHDPLAKDLQFLVVYMYVPNFYQYSYKT